MASPFPSPFEVSAAQMAAAQPEIARLRALVQAAFREQSPGGSAYTVDIQGFSSLAVREVSTELSRAGWRVESGDQREHWARKLLLFPQQPGDRDY